MSALSIESCYNPELDIPFSLNVYAFCNLHDVSALLLYFSRPVLTYQSGVLGNEQVHYFCDAARSLTSASEGSDKADILPSVQSKQKEGSAAVAEVSERVQEDIE